MSWRSHLPPAQWLLQYRAEWLKFDAVAGITLAAYAIPVSMAYASLAGLPPHHGIYCYLLGGACYAVFGTSRQLAIGPTSAIALLVGSTVAGMAGGDSSRWIAIAALSAMVVAALTVDAIPAGLPTISFSAIRLRDVDGILPLSCACFLLSYIESISAARTLAAKNNYVIDPRQELLALGAANLAVAFGQGFPVAGGLSQSAVNDKAGVRTTLSLLFALLTLPGCLLFLTGLLANLPTVVLASIVLVAVRGLIDLKALRHLWQVSRFEFKISMVALIGVLLLGILQGVLVAAIASLLMLLAGVAQPHVAFLGRILGTRRYSDLERHPDNESPEGIVIFRVESSLLYFNADYVRQIVWGRIEATPQLQLVICDLSDAPMVDVAGARMLVALNENVTKRAIQLRIVGAHAKVRDLLRAEALEERVGYLGRHISVDQAIEEFKHPSEIRDPSEGSSA